MARTWTASQEAAMHQYGKTVLVSAAAGSGKTSVLTERIIRSLTDPDSPTDLSRLLVVTFTRAAAAELKARIATALTEAMAARPTDVRLSNQLMKLGGADICTIDSFFQKLVRNNFEQLGITPTFRIADKSELFPICMELMEGLLEEFYATYATSSENPMQGNRFAEAIDNIMSNRSDGKLITTLLDFYETFSSYPEGIDLIRKSTEELRSYIETPYEASRYGCIIMKRLSTFAKTWADVLQSCDDELSADPDIYSKCYSLLSSDIEFCKALSNATTYTRATGLLNAFVTGRFPTIRNKPTAVARYQNLRTAFRREINKLQELFATPEPIIWEQMRKTADFSEIIYNLFAAYQIRLMDEKSARGILEHNDVRAYVYKLLSDPDGTPSAFSAALSSLYDAVYIDEYQDVDLLQDRIFALLGGNRRFMVGDIKQSIYGFRGSDPSIFADYRRRMPLYDAAEADYADGICIFMSENFRCDRTVINFANRVCGFLFSACEESVGYRPQDDLVCSKAGGNTDNPVQIAVFDRLPSSDDAEESIGDEAVWVANEIAHLLAEGKKDDGTPVTPSDIAVLVRTKAQGKAFSEALSTRNIAVNAEAARDLWKEPLTVDVLNLLRVIDNPYQDIPLTELLLSPLYGFIPAEISEIRASAPRHKALTDAMEVCSQGNSALATHCKDVLEELSHLRENAAIQPADRFLRLLYLDPKLSMHASEPALLYLYDRARLYQRSSWCGLYGFLEHIEKMKAGGAASAQGFAKAEEAVSIMTVHHSKGLEFPIVFLSACGAHFNRTDTHASLMFHRTVGCAVKLYDPMLCIGSSTALRDAVSICIDEKQSAESIRTLYVALTRARERLYVTGTLGGKWENALVAAETVTRGAVSSILSCNSYLAQILAALTEDSCSSHDYFLQHFPHSDVLTYSNDAPEERMSQKELKIPQSPRALQYAEILRAHHEKGYDLEILNGMPTKAAASKLRPDLLDRLFTGADEAENAVRQLQLMRSANRTFSGLLNTHHVPTAVEIGTATHVFLQFCDFGKLAANGVNAECQRLVDHGFITSEAAAILNRDQLEMVIHSNMMECIKLAKKIYRELRFALFMPLRNFTINQSLAEALGEQSLFVQGSIDLLLEMPDGALVLFDYKTDRIHEEQVVSPEAIREKMRNAHGDQLAVYAKAVTEMFGKAPNRIFLYSLPLGTALEF